MHQAITVTSIWRHIGHVSCSSVDQDENEVGKKQVSWLYDLKSHAIRIIYHELRACLLTALGYDASKHWKTNHQSQQSAISTNSSLTKNIKPKVLQMF